MTRWLITNGINVGRDYFFAYFYKLCILNVFAMTNHYLCGLIGCHMQKVFQSKLFKIIDKTIKFSFVGGFFLSGLITQVVSYQNCWQVIHENLLLLDPPSNILLHVLQKWVESRFFISHRPGKGSKYFWRDLWSQFLKLLLNILDTFRPFLVRMIIIESISRLMLSVNFEELSNLIYFQLWFRCLGQQLTTEFKK